jgi:hypothetical protein
MIKNSSSKVVTGRNFLKNRLGLAETSGIIENPVKAGMLKPIKIASENNLDFLLLIKYMLTISGKIIGSRKTMANRRAKGIMKINIRKLKRFGAKVIRIITPRRIR